MAVLKNVKDETLLLQHLKDYERYVLYLEITNTKRFNSALLYDAIKKLNTGTENPFTNFC